MAGTNSPRRFGGKKMAYKSCRWREPPSIELLSIAPQRVSEREQSTSQDSEMVGPQYDFLANPLGAVRSTFENAIASGSDPISFDGTDWGTLDLFRHFLFDHSHLSQVPSHHPLLFNRNPNLSTIIFPIFCVNPSEINNYAVNLGLNFVLLVLVGSVSHSCHDQIGEAQYSSSISRDDTGHAWEWILCRRL